MLFESMNAAMVARPVRPVIDRTFAFDEVHEGLRHLEQRAHFGTVAIAIPARERD